MPHNPPLDELSTVFARIRGMLLTEETVNHAVALLAQAVKEAIPGATGAGVSLMDTRGQRTSAGSTEELVLAADELQYKLGEGPCLDAWASTQVVRSDDVAADPRWPRWNQRAARMGIGSVLSAPLLHKTETLGAIKVYSHHTQTFDERSEQLLTLIAEPTATLLANIQSTEVPHRVSSELKQAILSRDSIAFARGILMERNGMDADEAMFELITLARREGQSLWRAADHVISSVGSRLQGPRGENGF